MIAHYFIQKVVKSTGFRKNPESRTFFVFEMWINLREKNEKGSFSVVSQRVRPYEYGVICSMRNPLSDFHKPYMTVFPCVTVEVSVTRRAHQRVRPYGYGVICSIRNPLSDFHKLYMTVFP